MPAPDVFILGGAQTDFAKNWTRNGEDLFAMFRSVLEAGFSATGIEPHDVDTAHVGNFAGELFAGQGQLGGFFGHVHPALAGIPASRHEAACASGSIAVLAGAAEIEAGRYGLACILGIELMRNVPVTQGAEYLGAAAWNGREATGATYLWPYMFAQLADEYGERYGIEREHLAGIAKKNFANARRNPNAQTRGWTLTDASFSSDDAANPPVEGTLRKQDCGQVTDGAAVIFLASRERAEAYARQRGIPLASIPRIKGWGHRTAPLLYDTKIAASANATLVFPHARRAIDDAFARAGLPDVNALDAIETHDCFTITEYMAVDHFGITAPGESWKAIEDGTTSFGGRLPVNASGGLIGAGHPVGATGVRMLLDSWRQLTGNAGDYQLDDPQNVATFNLGGSCTTCVSFIVGR